MQKLNKTTLLKKVLNKKSEDEMGYDELLEMLIDEPLAINVDKEEKRTFGEKLADAITKVAGSWSFILGFTLFLFIWMMLNTFVFSDVDDYPFILLNLILSCVAAIQAPIIMMSQNREAKKESLKSTNNYKTNVKSELILEELHDKINEILKNQKAILDKLNDEK